MADLAGQFRADLTGRADVPHSHLATICLLFASEELEVGIRLDRPLDLLKSGLDLILLKQAGEPLDVLLGLRRLPPSGCYSAGEGYENEAENDDGKQSPLGVMSHV